jgi:hypothetical protein
MKHEVIITGNSKKNREIKFTISWLFRIRWQKFSRRKKKSLIKRY